MSCWTSMEPHTTADAGASVAAALSTVKTQPAGRVTVIAYETHTSVCLGCGHAIELGRLYCDECSLTHELREAWNDVPAARTCEGCGCRISDLRYDPTSEIGICEDCEEAEHERIWATVLR